MRGSLYVVLKALESTSPASPGDIAKGVDLPRYRVLALFQVLEEAGLVEPIYSRGSYKIYVLTGLGRRVLLNMERGVGLREILEYGVEGVEGHGMAGDAVDDTQTISSGT